MVFSSFVMEFSGVNEFLRKPDGSTTCTIILTIILCAPILAAIGRLYYWNQYGSKKLPPGSTGLPILGWTPHILLGSDKDKLGSHLATKASKYGEMYFTSVPPLSSNCVVVNSYEAIKFIFSRENRGVVQEWPSSTQQLLGKASLARLTGVVHKRLRSKLVPIFQPKYLEQYTIKINSIVIKYLENNWKKGKQLVTTDEMRSVVFSIGTHLVLGLDGTCSIKDQESIDKLQNLLQTWFGGLFMPALHFPGSPFSKAMKARQELLLILSDLVQNRKESKHLSNQGDMLSVLLQPKIINAGDEPTHLTNEEIVDSLLTFLFAASDTSSCALTWIIKRLSENQDIFKKLKIEHTEIVRRRKKAQQQSKNSHTINHKDPTDYLTFQEIESTFYTKQFIQESLRIQSVISALNRVAEEDLFYKDFVIPKGTKILIDLKTLMLNPKHFPSPEKFCPDRTFSTGFLPFGSGVKMCIGKPLAMAEMTVIIHHLVLGYEWELSPNCNTDDVSYFPIPLFKDGLPINVTNSKSAPLSQ